MTNSTANKCCFCGGPLPHTPGAKVDPDPSGMCNNCFTEQMANAPAVTWTADDIESYAGVGNGH